MQLCRLYRIQSVLTKFLLSDSIAVIQIATVGRAVTGSTACGGTTIVEKPSCVNI